MKPIGNILIVDREPEWRIFSTHVLRSTGYTVESCSSTEDALKELAENGFDLIIIDAVLNNLIDTVALEYTDKRLLITTTSPSVPEAVMAFRRGALDYVKKIFDGDLLLSSVSVALRKKAVANRLVA